MKIKFQTRARLLRFILFCLFQKLPFACFLALMEAEILMARGLGHKIAADSRNLCFSVKPILSLHIFVVFLIQ